MPLPANLWQKPTGSAPTRISAQAAARTLLPNLTAAYRFLRRAWLVLPHSSLLFGHGIWIALLAWRLAGNCAESGADMAAFRAFQSSLHVVNASVWRLDGTETVAESLRCLPENATEF